MRKKMLFVVILLMLFPFIPYHLMGAEAQQGTCGTNVKYTITGNTINFSKEDPAVTVVNINDSIKAPANDSHLFHNYSYIQEMYLSKLDVSDMTSMWSTFKGCSSLVSLDVSGWNTSNVTNMMYMFEDCSLLKSLDVSGWNTSNVTNMMFMFHECSALTSLDVSGWNTSNVTNMLGMFYDCSSLTSLDVSRWDTSNVTDMSFVFSGCSSLTSLDVSRWDTSNVTDMSSVFSSCSSLTSLDVSGWKTSNVTDMSSMFWECPLTSLDVSRWDTSNVTDMGAMFTNSSLTSLDVSGWDTSNVTDMSWMFYECSSLTSLDVSRWNTSNVTDMHWMFENCSSLTSLDVSGWDTSNVTSMSRMFERCSSLASLDVSKWKTSNVTNMEYMYYNCSSLTSLDVSGWDTSNVTNMFLVFSYCSSLTSLDVSGWDTANVTDMRYMFSRCSSLRTITLGKNSVNTNIYGSLPAYNEPWTYIAQGADAEQPLPLNTKKTNAALFTAYDYKTMAGTWKTGTIPGPEIGAVTIVQINDDGTYTDVTKKTVEIDVTSNETISLKAKEANGTGLSFTWKNSAVKFADLIPSGDTASVAGVQPGTAKITVSCTDGKKTVSAEVTVKVVSKVAPGNINVSGPKGIAVGKTGKFTAVIGTQTWAPSNKAVVWVLGEGASENVILNSSGAVTGKAATASPVEIKACAKDSQSADGTYGNCVAAQVKVTEAADGVEIKLINGTTTLEAGETVDLKAVVSPSAALQDVEWTAKSSKVADVEFNEDGTLKVTARSKGTITVKAVTADGTKKSASVKLTVGVKVKPGMLSIKVAGDTVAVKKTLKLTAVFDPVPSNKKVVWSIAEGEPYVTLKNGAVTGAEAGKAVVKVCSEENPDVCVTKDVFVVVPVTSVKLDPAKPLPLDIGGGPAVLKFTAEILPADASIKELEWSSSNESVAEVDENGKVTAKSVGTAVITAAAKDGSKKSGKVTLKVVSGVQPGSLMIEGTGHELKPKETMELTWKFSQPNAPTNQKLTWKSSDPKTASVSAKGVVKAIKVGSAVITATSADNKSVFADWAVTVDAPVSDEILMDEISAMEVMSGADAVTEEVPAEAAGIDEVTPDETEIPETAETEDTEMPEAAETETAEVRFAEDEAWLQVGESMILDVVNPEDEAVMVGLGGDTEAVLWNEELRMLSAVSEAEVTAFLASVDTVEVKDMMTIHIVSALPEEEDVSEESGETEGIITEAGEETITESEGSAEGEDISEAAVPAEGEVNAASSEGEDTSDVTDPAENAETADPAEGEDLSGTDEPAETAVVSEDASEPEEGEGSSEPSPEAAEEEAPEAGPVEIRIRDLDEYEPLTGEANTAIVIERERFEIEDGILLGLVFETDNEMVAKVAEQTDEERLADGLNIRLLAAGETKLLIRQEQCEEPLLEIRLVVTSAPEAAEEPSDAEIPEAAAEPESANGPDEEQIPEPDPVESAAETAAAEPETEPEAETEPEPAADEPASEE